MLFTSMNTINLIEIENINQYSDGEKNLPVIKIYISKFETQTETKTRLVLKKYSTQLICRISHHKIELNI